MEDSAKIPVTLPLPNPTTSYWQYPPSDIANLRSTDDLPKHADYVIIGSGISGASIAYNLLKRKPEASVLMLEARSTCSGATGRNGCHTKAASYRSFPDHEKHHCTEEAVKIARLEHANIRQTHALIRELGIECGASACDTVDIIYDASTFTQGKKAIRRMREVMGEDDPAAKYTIFGAEEARKRFLTPGALGAFVYEAGSLSAYGFAVGVLKVCLRSGMQLHTQTPVEAVLPAQDFDAEKPRWVIKTARGDVETGKVIVATNGYTPFLLPRFQGTIVPLRGQVVAQRPGSGLSQRGLQTTYSFIYKEGYEYMITRPQGTKDAGAIVIGGGLGTLPQDGASEFGNTKDTELNGEISTYLYECTERYFGGNWGDDAKEGRTKREWSGIMGTSADGLPFVGAVPDMDGVFISASFNGHGMVLCLKCAEALVDVLVEGEVGGWFPRAMMMGEERFGRRFEGRLNMRVPGEGIFDGPEEMEQL